MSILHILTIAALDWRNGHEYALQAMAELQRRNIPFEYDLVGEGPFLEAVAFARHELGLDDAVRMIRSASPGEVKDYSRRAEVYLLAAVSGGAVNGLHEPDFMGKPIVCSDLSELAERFAQHKPLYVVRRRDAAALVEVLVGLAKVGAG